MRPQYWIGIFAIIGSIAGTSLGLIFDLNSTVVSITGTFVGVVIGTFIFTLQQNNTKDKNKQ
jgi:uncharacterized membrane protein YccC